MKKNLIALAIVHLTALAGISGANAQKLSNASGLEYQNSITESTKVISVKGSLGEPVPISPKALKNFASLYRNVTNESWEKVSDGFSVNFVSNDTQTTIFYNHKGNWVARARYYHEEKMPQEIRHIVKSTYYDYTIIYVQEIETTESNGIPTYIISMEDKSNIKLIRIRAGEMGIWKEFVKA